MTVGEQSTREQIDDQLGAAVHRWWPLPMVVR